MTLQYTGTLDIGSKTWYDGVYDEDTAEIIIVASDTLRKYSLETGSQVGSDLSLGSTGRCVALVGASAIVGRSTSSSWSLVELESLYESTFGANVSLRNSGTSSRAFDRDNKIAMFNISTNAAINIYNGNTFTLTTKRLDIPSNNIAYSVVYKEPNRFIIGCDGGVLIEVDQNGVVVQRRHYSRPAASYSVGENFALQSFRPDSLQYYDGFLYIFGNYPENIIVMDWTTGEMVHHSNSISCPMVSMVIESSGTMIVAREETQAIGSNAYLYETNPYNYGWLSNKPDLNNDVLYISSPGSIVAMGFDSASSIGWFLQETIDDLRTFTVSATSGLTETTHSSPNNEDFRLIIVDETNGQGSLEVVVDTYTTSPRTLHLPAGRNMIEIIKVGDGVNAQWDVSRYST